MPIYMEISQLHRTVVIVGRGRLSAEEIRVAAERLVAANVPGHAKIIEIAGATTEMTQEQVAGIAALFRSDSPERRGPVAFIVNQDRPNFSTAYEKMTRGEIPVRLCRSLREARRWIEDMRQAPVSEPEPLSPDRQGVLIRGGRYRNVTVDSVDQYVAAAD